MRKQRIEIIIKEINYWKTHKLLPKVYCDFLLALYTEGEGTESADQKEGSLRASLQLFIQVFLLLLSILIINFDQTSIIVKNVFLLLSLLIILWMFLKSKRQDNLYFNLSLWIFLVSILTVSIHMGKFYIPNHWIINLIAGMNFIGWFLLGKIYDLKYIQIISVFAFIFISFYVFLS